MSEPSRMDLDEIMQLTEGWDFEAKLAEGRNGQGRLPASFWESYAAMANTQGGRILLGAREDEEHRLELRGLSNVERILTDLWNTLENRQKVSANVLRREDVQVIELDGRFLVLIEVPKASRAQRPIFLNRQWERVFVRSYEGDRLVTPEVARRMLADADPERDSQPVEDFDVQDLDPQSVRRFREVFSVLRPDHPYTSQDEQTFLTSWGVLHRERQSGKLRPTRAGLWMLGGERSIRERYPFWHLSFIERPGDDVSLRWLDRLAPDGTWNANLFEFYLLAIRRVHADLKVPFGLDAGQFRKDETPIHVALREALVNALVHADYSGPGGLRIIRYPNRFEFVNPGLLLLPVEQVWRGGLSVPRNPLLQRLFGAIRLGEREGSGGPVMRAAWEAQSWRAPRLWEDAENQETHLELSQESVLPPEAVDELVARWGERFLNLEPLARTILVTVSTEGEIVHGRLRSLSVAHPRELTMRLQRLVRQGFLVSQGAHKGTRYLLPASSAPRTAPAQQDHESTSSEPNATSSEPNATSSEPNATSSEPNATSSDTSASLSSTERIHSAILIHCRDTFLSVKELSTLLARSEQTVRKRYLPFLVESGTLELKYPEKPRHPSQAYRTVQGVSSSDEDAPGDGS